MNYLTLVNKKHKIKDNYFKHLNLISTKDVLDDELLVEETTLNAYLELERFLNEKNIIIGLASGYRTLENQQAIYDEFVITYGKEYADSFVAPVGTSEHHTGLALDLSIYKDDKFLLDNLELIKEEETYKMIHKYLVGFGFILRYSKGKESITGYPYEPWHIRYVGKLAAKIITDNDLTLEEYLDDFSGIAILDKEKDMTSFDVVEKLSRALGIKRVGHTGTLDPLATGVLVVTIGKATKISNLLMTTYKEYIATVKLGVKTDTLDITGKVLLSELVPSNLDISGVLKSFKKTYNQEVPAYSAVKVNGKKLYEYARENIKVDLPIKEVTIKEIELLEQNDDTFKFRCLVSKGTYIRSLIRDIGNSLGVSATMTDLIRSKQGNFSLDEAFKLSSIDDGTLKIIKIEEALSEYEKIKVDEVTASKIRNGVKQQNNNNIDDKVIFLDESGNLLAIYEVDCNDKSILKAYYVFNTTNKIA